MRTIDPLLSFLTDCRIGQKRHTAVIHLELHTELEAGTYTRHYSIARSIRHQW